MRYNFFIALLFLAGLGLTFISVYWPVTYAYQQIMWQRTEARLLGTTVKENSDFVYYSFEFTNQQGRVFHVKEDTDNHITEGRDDQHYILYYNPANPEEFVMANFGRYLIVLFLPFGLFLSYVGWPDKVIKKRFKS